MKAKTQKVYGCKLQLINKEWQKRIQWLNELDSGIYNNQVRSKSIYTQLIECTSVLLSNRANGFQCFGSMVLAGFLVEILIVAALILKIASKAFQSKLNLFKYCVLR